ncbi:S8 family serine peptidase [Evansella sp. AB-P1]|uniref:S8 family serine peptidase n=1 Tax=Evansella sp. AB-P1 TaxID=3037653 RepID=UPI0024204672|nr:S8 family serine peptidase [Evansella sp. AB-P1]MDG5786696.1 S8 family serine peptidase [Evansella sp. AB-P1]
MKTNKLCILMLSLVTCIHLIFPIYTVGAAQENFLQVEEKNTTNDIVSKITSVNDTFTLDEEQSSGNNIDSNIPKIIEEETIEETSDVFEKDKQLEKGIEEKFLQNKLSEIDNNEEKFIVLFKNKANKELILQSKGNIYHEYKNLPAMAISIPSQAIHALKNNPNVIAVESIELFDKQSQIVDWGIERLEAQKAWSNGFTGKGIKVAVIDSGIDTTHPDLNVVGCFSATNAPTCEDDDGHGTHVAGIIGAIDNDFGVVGVAPEVDIYAARVSTIKGEIWSSDVLAGIDWAISQGVDIINISLGSNSYSSAIDHAITKAYNEGILIVAAAGNDNHGSVSFPAAHPNVIAVSATDSNNRITEFSNIGTEIELSAPGVSIHSTFLRNSYATHSGTSMATPHVTGVIALLLEAKPTLNNIEIRKLLLETALDLGLPGKDQYFGYGLVQAPSYLLSDSQDSISMDIPLEEPDESVHLKTADEWFEFAMSQSNSSDRLLAYSEGYLLYPNDDRFEKGINDSARSLLRWAGEQHNFGRYDTALDRYQRILNAPILNDAVKRDTEVKLGYAELNRNIPTADDLNNTARKQSTSSERLVFYIEGYNLYPQDTRFAAGINSSSQSLLRWAKGQHKDGHFNIAIDRYEAILLAPELLTSITKETKFNLYHAESRKRTPDMYFDIAISQSSSSPRLEVFMEAFELYPEDKRFDAGINSSARSLLRWTTSQHQAGNLNTAIDRYETLLNVPTLSEETLHETKIKLDYALAGKTLPTAKDIYHLAKQQSTSSDRLSKFIEGYSLYPNDDRFETGINNSGRSLLNWAIQQHNDGRYETAIDRYEIILLSPVLHRDIMKETKRKLEEAKEGKRPADVIFELAKQQPTSSARLALYIEGHEFYPYDSRFEVGINSSAQSLLSWAKEQHQKENFSTAIDRYHVIINGIGVNNNIKEEVKSLLSLAELGLIPGREVITYTTYNLTLSEAQARQSQLNPPPQTDLYRNEPGFIHSSFVDIVNRGVTNVNSVRLRTSPNLSDSSIAVTVAQGTTFTILREVKGDTWSSSDTWFRISYLGQTLYVHKDLVDVTKIAVVTEPTNVREVASTNSHSYGRVSKGSEWNLLEEVTGGSISGNNNWIKIRYSTWRNAKPDHFINYLDPNQNDRFQHLVLDKSTGVSAVQLNNVLSGKGILQGLGQAFITAGERHSINEVYLISHALLETGNGTSPLATGMQVNGRTVYNMYGIGAFDSCPYTCGAQYAYDQGWFTPNAAIIGGAQFIANSYLKRGQNTLYKMRWNHKYLNSWHGHSQYATDMGWAVKQLPRIKALYDQLENPILYFDIVKYKK